MKPWETIESRATADGTMTLLRRGDDDFLIKLDEIILMNSRLSLSERLLAEAACGQLRGDAPRVLLGGLGMGCTLRAALDALPAGARVTVAELNPVVVRWCRGPLRDLTTGAVDDPRVTVKVADVAREIGSARSLDAVILDLYQGTHDANTDNHHPFYGLRALERAHDALKRGGVFAAWTEERDRGFEARLVKAGFSRVEHRRARSGPRHIVYLGHRL